MGISPGKCFGSINSKKIPPANSVIRRESKINGSSEHVVDYGIDIDEKYKGSMKIVRSKSGKMIYQRRDNLIFSMRILEIKKKLYLSENHILKIWSFFKTIDEEKSGYINLHDLYGLLEESISASTIATIIDRFFVIIDKEYSDKVSFEELLPYLVSMCLNSTSQLIDFIFDLIDINRNGYVSRDEIVDYLDVRRGDKRLFLLNHAEAIRTTENIERSDKITPEEFEILCRKMPFIYYPAVVLQEKLRNFYISSSFWRKLQKEITHRHLENLKIDEKKKIYDKIDELQVNLLEDKIKVYENRVEVDKKLRNKENEIYYETYRLKRKNSDTIFYCNVLSTYKRSKVELEKDKINYEKECVLSHRNEEIKFDIL